MRCSVLISTTLAAVASAIQPAPPPPRGEQLAPTPITLRFADAHPAEVIPVFLEQANIPAEWLEPGLFGRADMSRITIDVVDAPMMGVLHDLVEQAGLQLGGFPPHRIVRRHFEHARPIAVSGPAIFIAHGAERRASVQTDGTIAREARIGVSALFEPRIMLGGSAELIVDRITRDDGKAVRPIAGDPRITNRDGRGVHFYIPLPVDEDLGAHVTVAGRLIVEATADTATLDIDFEQDPTWKPMTIGEMSVELEQFDDIGDNRYRVKFRVLREKASPADWKQLTPESVQRIRIIGSTGQPWMQLEGKFRRSDDVLELEWMYQRVWAQDAGAPARLMWSLPVGTRQVEVPFVLEALPTP